MFFPESHVRVWLYATATDTRKSFDVHRYRFLGHMVDGIQAATWMGSYQSRRACAGLR